MRTQEILRRVIQAGFYTQGSGIVRYGDRLTQSSRFMCYACWNAADAGCITIEAARQVQRTIRRYLGTYNTLHGALYGAGLGPSEQGRSFTPSAFEQYKTLYWNWDKRPKLENTSC